MTESTLTEAREEPTATSEDCQPKNPNLLLWLLLAVAVLFALLHPRSPLEYVHLVDWQTIGALAGLLAITQGVERSGVLQATAQRVLSHVTDLRRLTLLLTA